MNGPDLEPQWLVWDYISKSWTEIGLDEGQFPKYAQKIQQSYPKWHDVKPIIEDVIIFFSALMPLMLLFFPMIPDWGYDKAYLITSIQKMRLTPTWKLWINPFRWVGYPIAKLMTQNYVKKLKYYYF